MPAITMSKRMDIWPDQLEAESCPYPKHTESSLSIVSKRAKSSLSMSRARTNQNMFAGLYYADIVLIPLQMTQGDVAAGMQ